MYEESRGTITIATNVLNTIARLTTLAVPGVARMGASGQLLQAPGGVLVRVADGRVKADIYVVARSETNFFELGQKIQYEVSRSIQEIVGMEVEAVNVHVQDVEYAPADAKTADAR
jgi:uncharacterized alkaline shock family protein YloU